MGWASGSLLMGEVISAIHPEIADADKRKALYTKLIGAFEDMDWDTQDECMGADPAFDEALKERHPDWFED